MAQSLNVLHSRQECSGIVEVRWLALGPGIKFGCVDENLAVRSEFDVSAVHGTRCRAFEVDTLAVVSATMARALEFVFARLPIRGAAEMRATSVDHEEAVRRAVDPDAILLLKFGVDAKRKFRRVADFEQSVRLEKSARKEEAKESQKPGHQEAGDHGPDEAAAMAVDFGGG